MWYLPSASSSDIAGILHVEKCTLHVEKITPNFMFHDI